MLSFRQDGAVGDGDDGDGDRQPGFTDGVGRE
jgi:hypothetical protein